MTQSVKERVYAVVAKSISVDASKLDDEIGPGDIPEWDSLAHQDVIMSLEKDFQISFDLDDVLEIEVIADIVQVIEGKMQAA